MNWLEFESKLKNLNPRIYLQRNIISSFNPELMSTGIYFKDRVYGFDDVNRNVGSKTRKAIDRMNSIDEYLGFCTVKHIPEGNLYNKEGELTARGWREILLDLSRREFVDIKRARKVFKCPSLGLSSYDKLTDDEKSSNFLEKKQEKYALFNTGLDKT